MSKKNNLIYKIITIFTLVAPVTLYMFLSATLFNIEPDMIVANTTSEQLIIDGDFAYTNNSEVIYNGSVVYEGSNYGFYLTEDMIIKLDDGYFNENLEDIEAFALQQETSYKLPMAFIVSALGVGIVLMVVNRKMEWYKTYPRIFVLVSLVTGTLVLTMLNVFVSNLLTVFVVASASWAIYCVEYMVKENILTDEEGKKTESDLINSLKDALNG